MEEPYDPTDEFSGPRWTSNGINISDDELADMDELREAHEVKFESDELVVFADSTGHEINEFADDMALSRSELSEKLHDLARDHYGRDQSDGQGDPWGYLDPIVIAKE